MVNFKEISFPSRLFITGIDTDAGKSYATGWLARGMLNAGLNVVTQKFVQTGNIDTSEDIEIHRKLTGTGFLQADTLHLTAPQIFTYPASPDLAARIDKKELDLTAIDNATDKLSTMYDNVLIEGAGGLMVPLKGEYLTIDYIKEHNLPTVLVTNGRLGSINHTLLSLFALQQYSIHIFAVIYNAHFDKDEIICADTRDYIQSWLSSHSPSTLFLEMPSL
ncbi:MAG: dethiobiotin synthase [Muribaculaceae bacterium]|nr:dethiobiotin synthase [Muribaculaceae bacterium]